MENKEIVYYDEDAIEFIHERSGLSKKMISKVLELEFEYMRNIGLVCELEELEHGKN